MRPVLLTPLCAWLVFSGLTPRAAAQAPQRQVVTGGARGSALGSSMGD